MNGAKEISLILGFGFWGLILRWETGPRLKLLMAQGEIETPVGQQSPSVGSSCAHPCD